MAKDEPLHLLSETSDSENTLFKTAGIFLIGTGLLLYAISIAESGQLVGIPASLVLMGCASLLVHRLKK